jgi:signal peptidase II
MNMKISIKADPLAHLIFWPTFAAGLFLDLWSKDAVLEYLQAKSAVSVSIINGFFQIVSAFNDGAAFGIAAGQIKFLVAISAIALVVVLIIFLFGSQKNEFFYLALGFLAAGISGNFYDRLFNDGLVRDFIDVYVGKYHWPAFNAADSLLCTAVGLIILLSFTGLLSQRLYHRQK